MAFRSSRFIFWGYNMFYFVNNGIRTKALFFRSEVRARDFLRASLLNTLVFSILINADISGNLLHLRIRFLYNIMF